MDKPKISFGDNLEKKTIILEDKYCMTGKIGRGSFGKITLLNILIIRRYFQSQRSCK